MSKAEFLKSVRQLRKAYSIICRSLPWLDMSAWNDDPPAFKEYAKKVRLPSVKSMLFSGKMKGRIARYKKAENVRLLRYSPSSGLLEDMRKFFPEMEEQETPLVVLHTDTDFPVLKKLARCHPDMTFIIESGPEKILYFVEQIELLMLSCRNVFLCTYNLCNWLILERFCEKGLGTRLLFGTHQPRYNPHAAIGPIALGRLAWEEKCNIAGNNLRRLLDMPAIMSSEPVYDMPAPFIIDAHGHSGPTGKFPVADDNFGPEGWREFMDHCAIERIFLCPAAALNNKAFDSASLTAELRKSLPGRIFFFTPFFPEGDREAKRVEGYLQNSDCVGVKIHPSFHNVAGDNLLYTAVYKLAERYNIPVMTHSWDISATNPVQHLSHPDRFRPHLKKHPGATLILGHAGGRPGAIESVTALCREFPRAMVDLSGDYYDNGLIEKLTHEIGGERILFGSDINWIDPRTNLSRVLAADIPDGDVLKILRTNALEMQGAGRAPFFRKNRKPLKH